MERSLSAYAVAIYASFPLCALWLADRAARHGRNDEILQTSGSRWRLRGIGATLLFLGLAVITAHLAAQRSERTVLMLHHSAERHEWHEVLQLAHAHKLYSVRHPRCEPGLVPRAACRSTCSPIPRAAARSWPIRRLIRTRFCWAGKPTSTSAQRVNQAGIMPTRILCCIPMHKACVCSRIAIVKQTDVSAVPQWPAEFNHGVWAEEQLRRLD